MSAIPLNNTLLPLEFLMIDSSNHLSGKTGLTPTVTICKSAGSFQTPSGAISEIGKGWYKIAPNSNDADTGGRLLVHAEATGADHSDTVFEVVSNLEDSYFQTVRDPVTATYYGDVTSGDSYWDSQLGGASWKDSIRAEKTQALRSATILIDRLRFRYEKTDTVQVLQFPRNSETTIPLDIDNATYEIAERLLSGEDLEMVVRNLSIAQTNHGGLLTTRASEAVPDHLAAGIPSSVAWAYLLPYLKMQKFKKRS